MWGDNIRRPPGPLVTDLFRRDRGADGLRLGPSLLPKVTDGLRSLVLSEAGLRIINYTLHNCGALYICTCARAHPFSVSRKRLDGFRGNWCVVRRPIHFTKDGVIFSITRVTVRNLSTSIRSRSFIAQKEPYGFYELARWRPLFSLTITEKG